MRQVCVFPGTPVSSTNKTDCYDITEILLKVVLRHNKPNQTKSSRKYIDISIYYQLFLLVLPVHLNLEVGEDEDVFIN